MKKLFLLLLIFLFNINIYGQENKKVITACHSTWGKLGGKQLPYQGIHAHFIEAVFQEAGYTVKTEIIPWARCVQSVKFKKNYDLTMAWESNEFKQYFEFFSYAITTPLNFYVKKDSNINNGSLNNMKSKKIAYVSKTGGLDSFYKRESEFKTFPVSNVEQMFKMLKLGRVDALIIDPISFEDEINNRFERYRDLFKKLQPPIQINIASPAIAKDHPRLEELKNAYEKAYKKFVNKKFIKELEQTHRMEVYR